MKNPSTNLATLSHDKADVMIQWRRGVKAIGSRSSFLHAVPHLTGLHVGKRWCEVLTTGAER